MQNIDYLFFDSTAIMAHPKLYAVVRIWERTHVMAGRTITSWKLGVAWFCYGCCCCFCNGDKKKGGKKSKQCQLHCRAQVSKNAGFYAKFSHGGLLPPAWKASKQKLVAIDGVKKLPQCFLGWARKRLGCWSSTNCLCQVWTLYVECTQLELGRR